MAAANVTQLLSDLQAGNRRAFDLLLAEVYDELRSAAEGDVDAPPRARQFLHGTAMLASQRRAAALTLAEVR